MAGINKIVVVEDWTFIVSTVDSSSGGQDINVEVRHASGAPLSLHESARGCTVRVPCL
jgi:hypothetical protein